MAIISVSVLIPTTEEPINSIHPVHASEGLSEAGGNKSWGAVAHFECSDVSPPRRPSRL